MKNWKKVIKITKNIQMIVVNDRHGLQVLTCTKGFKEIYDRAWITYDRDTFNLIIER